MKLLVVGLFIYRISLAISAGTDSCNQYTTCSECSKQTECSWIFDLSYVVPESTTPNVHCYIRTSVVEVKKALVPIYTPITKSGEKVTKFGNEYSPSSADVQVLATLANTITINVKKIGITSAKIFILLDKLGTTLTENIQGVITQLKTDFGATFTDLKFAVGIYGTETSGSAPASLKKTAFSITTTEVKAFIDRHNIASGLTQATMSSTISTIFSDTVMWGAITSTELRLLVILSEQAQPFSSTGYSATSWNSIKGKYIEKNARVLFLVQQPNVENVKTMTSSDLSIEIKEITDGAHATYSALIKDYVDTLVKNLEITIQNPASTELTVVSAVRCPSGASATSPPANKGCLGLVADSSTHLDITINSATCFSGTKTFTITINKIVQIPIRAISNCLCSCEADATTLPPSAFCNLHGKLSCGKCTCDKGHGGNKCETVVANTPEESPGLAWYYVLLIVIVVLLALAGVAYIAYRYMAKKNS